MTDSTSKPAGRLERFMHGLKRTRDGLLGKVSSLLPGGVATGTDWSETLENALIEADLGPETAARIVDEVRGTSGTRAPSWGQVRSAARGEILRLLAAPGAGTQTTAAAAGGPAGRPRVILIVGVNGGGKTTTAGKLARRLVAAGAKVMLCPADTFRAGAGEQLKIWATRAGAEFSGERPGADPSAVAFDAAAAAEARGIDALIVDTAGRLHTQDPLMRELEKVRRVLGRRIAGAPHEVLLVLDATTGQNGLPQARRFLDAAGVGGLVLTKIDGTARGGIAVRIVQELGLPLRYLGVGEGPDDLIDFDPEAFVDGLLPAAA
ncbi:MAG TPA: signal recognition particle-docking protein FtsY [Candidatus Polarisedimenticolia bacterium]|nr:signal recognition particle-docking protein FtsY [Candidatus Polarisedimenticolia bacterium]